MSESAKVGQALCCVCGTLKIYHSSYQGRPIRGTVRREGGRSTDFARCLAGMKCATCNQWTLHAYLRTDTDRDVLEDLIYGRGFSWWSLGDSNP